MARELLARNGLKVQQQGDLQSNSTPRVLLRANSRSVNDIAGAYTPPEKKTCCWVKLGQDRGAERWLMLEIMSYNFIVPVGKDQKIRRSTDVWKWIAIRNISKTTNLCITEKLPWCQKKKYWKINSVHFSVINLTWDSDSAGTGRTKESNQACLVMVAVILGEPV